MMEEFVVGKDYADLDGMHIAPPEIMAVGSEQAHALVGRDIAEVSVTAKDKDLVWVTVRFPAQDKDIATLRAMATNVAIENSPWLRGESHE